MLSAAGAMPRRDGMHPPVDAQEVNTLLQELDSRPDERHRILEKLRSMGVVLTESSLTGRTWHVGGWRHGDPAELHSLILAAEESMVRVSAISAEIKLYEKGLERLHDEVQAATVAVHEPEDGEAGIAAREHRLVEANTELEKWQGPFEKGIAENEEKLSEARERVKVAMAKIHDHNPDDMSPGEKSLILTSLEHAQPLFEAGVTGLPVAEQMLSPYRDIKFDQATRTFRRMKEGDMQPSQAMANYHLQVDANPGIESELMKLLQEIAEEERDIRATREGLQVVPPERIEALAAREHQYALMVYNIHRTIDIGQQLLAAQQVEKNFSQGEAGDTPTLKEPLTHIVNACLAVRNNEGTWVDWYTEMNHWTPLLQIFSQSSTHTGWEAETLEELLVLLNRANNPIPDGLSIQAQDAAIKFGVPLKLLDVGAMGGGSELRLNTDRLTDAIQRIELPAIAVVRNTFAHSFHQRVQAGTELIGGFQAYLGRLRTDLEAGLHGEFMTLERTIMGCEEAIKSKEREVASAKACYEALSNIDISFTRVCMVGYAKATGVQRRRDVSAAEWMETMEALLNNVDDACEALAPECNLLQERDSLHQMRDSLRDSVPLGLASPDMESHFRESPFSTPEFRAQLALIPEIEAMQERLDEINRQIDDSHIEVFVDWLFALQALLRFNFDFCGRLTTGTLAIGRSLATVGSGGSTSALEGQRPVAGGEFNICSPPIQQIQVLLAATEEEEASMSQERDRYNGSIMEVLRRGAITLPNCRYVRRLLELQVITPAQLERIGRMDDITGLIVENIPKLMLDDLLTAEQAAELTTRKEIAEAIEANIQGNIKTVCERGRYMLGTVTSVANAVQQTTDGVRPEATVQVTFRAR